MTPLGLNLISPVSPFSPRDTHGTARQTGFTPMSPTSADVRLERRGSTASTTSTLTQSRPLPSQAQQHPPALVYPPNWNPGRRRSSLTPALPTSAATRTHANGRVASSRPTSSEGASPSSRSRTRTADATAVDGAEVSPGATNFDNYGRRGSMPHLGRIGQARWNPSLPPSRGSVGDGAPLEIDHGFKFGSGTNAVAGPSAAAAALRAVDPRGAALKKRESRDAFEQAEDDEAERQRRAFLAATYGEDGRRARERLSIGGASGYSGSPGTPGANLRRQSLMLWEKMGAAHELSTAAIGADLGVRRGSLPVAIPPGGVGMGRRASRVLDMDHPVVRHEGSPPDETDEEDEEVSSDQEQADASTNVGTWCALCACPLADSSCNRISPHLKDRYRPCSHCPTPAQDCFPLPSHYTVPTIS